MTVHLAQSKQQLQQGAIDYEASLSLLSENGMVEIGGIALNEVKKWNLPGYNEKEYYKKLSLKNLKMVSV